MSRQSVQGHWEQLFRQNATLAGRQDVGRTAKLLAESSVSPQTVKDMSGRNVYAFLEEIIKDQLDGDDKSKFLGWSCFLKVFEDLRAPSVSSQGERHFATCAQKFQPRRALSWLRSS